MVLNLLSNNKFIPYIGNFIYKYRLIVIIIIRESESVTSPSVYWMRTLLVEEKFVSIVTLTSPQDHKWFQLFSFNSKQLQGTSYHNGWRCDGGGALGCLQRLHCCWQRPFSFATENLEIHHCWNWNNCFPCNPCSPLHSQKKTHIVIVSSLRNVISKTTNCQ